MVSEKLTPPIHWFGGKGQFMEMFMPYIPEHICFVDVYGGSGAFLIAKDRSNVEIFNDIFGDVVNLYQCIRDHFEELRDELLLTPYSRKELEKCWYGTREAIIDFGDVERARKFFVLARQAFSGKISTRPGWSVSTQRNAALTWLKVVEGLDKIHERLQGVILECGDALKIIGKYDSKDTFFYLDPPYIKESRSDDKNAYVYEVDDRHHLNLVTKIKDVKGMVLLSGYHNEFYDFALDKWHYKEFEVVSRAAHTVKETRKRLEVLWWNDALQAKRCGAQMYIPFSFR